MSKKNRGGMVYSTNPNLNLDSESEDQESIPISEQLLTLHRETKGRAGKSAAIVRGFVGPEADLQALGKKIKAHCGTGGSVKDNEIIVQGDQRPKVDAFLQSLGYRTKIVGG